MKLAIESGESIEFAMKRAAPPVHFTRERHVSEALRAWTPARLVRAMEQLAEVSLEMRRNAPLAETIAQRMLLSLAVNARKAAEWLFDSLA
jgi:DNA polymerase-3 subunit delta